MSKMHSAGAVAVTLLLAAAAAGCAETEAQSRQLRVERGKYLVTIGGCHDCHTPMRLGPKGPEPDSSLVLAGHPEAFPIREAVGTASEQWLMSMAATGTAFSGPWGVSFAANLTPDENTGLGIWTEDMFMAAMRTGRHMGVSRQILPPMPWHSVGAMTDEDIKAVYAYLRSIRPVHNRVPEPIERPAAQSAALR